MTIADDLFFRFTRAPEQGGVNPGRDLIFDPKIQSRALDSADMRQNLLILYALTAGANARRVLEIGTSDGTSTLAFLKAASEIDGHVTSIDLDEVPVAEALINQFGLRSRWTFMRGNSHDILPQLRREDHEFDLILVDGDHTYEGALKDVIDSAALLKDGGILLFHDSNMMVSGDGAGCGAVVVRLLQSDGWQGFTMPFNAELTLFQRTRSSRDRLAKHLAEQAPHIASVVNAGPLDI